MKHLKYFIFIALLPISTLSFTKDIYCDVVGVSSGDTINCLTDEKKQIKVKLYQIDAPKKKQTFGNESKQALSDLVLNTRVLLEAHGKDKYRRTLGTIYHPISIVCPTSPESTSCVYPKGIDINFEMINKGMAQNSHFANQNEQYKQAEEQARKNKIGLWADK